MTRKRFVKLLMALGYDRNEANEVAWRVQREGYSYETAYKLVNCTHLFIPKLADSLRREIEKATKTISRMTTALTAAVVAFREAYAEAVTQ